jgi:hypothetical protein
MKIVDFSLKRTLFIFKNDIYIYFFQSTDTDVAGLNELMGSQLFPLLIIGSPTAI